MEADQVQQLLQKCLSGAGSQEDWELLKKCLEEEKFSLLREEVRRLGKLSTKDLVADEQKMWEKISKCREAGQNRLKLSRRLLRYAAIIALPLLLGGIFLCIQQLKQGAPEVVVAVIKPGFPQAILKMNNGELIDLSAEVKDTVLIREGITIRLDSSRCLSYQGDASTLQTTIYNTLLVPQGGEYRLVLADGSVVWLNSASELRYPVAFSGNERKVFLKGEAYFEVAKNKQAPFLVNVADMEVEVLGTRFNINAYRYDGTFQTTLVSGKVKVSDLKTAESVILKPDQQALAKEGKLSVREVDAEVYTAWRDGKFYFESETLEEIAAQLERWYNIHFFFSREELKHYKFTGVIRKDFTANKMLDIISKTTNVQFEVKENTVNVR